MFKYAKYIFVALIFSGLLAISYGGCGGGSDDTSGGGTTTPTNPPTNSPPTSSPMPTNTPPTNTPPTSSPNPGGCEGNAFNGSEDCLTDFILENAETSGLVCFCNASEAGDFILNISPNFEGFMKMNLDFPEDDNSEDPFPNSFSFDWTVSDCDSIELFTTQIFVSDDLISIGTLDNMNESAPDQLTFTANISEPILSEVLGNSGQSVSCDFCSIDSLPGCAPEL